MAAGRRLSGLFMLGAALLGAGWGVQRCEAGIGFPLNATDGQTFSIGAFRIVVDPSFAFLFAPSNSLSYYPGYAGPASGILTSPAMFDGNTMIGESSGHVRPATVFPIAVGTPGQYPPGSTYSNVLGYGDIALIPSAFGSAPSGIDEIFTQIEQMNLTGYVALSNSPCGDPRVPTVRSQTMGQLVSVKAGPQIPGIGPTLPMNRRSLGMVQQITPGSPIDPDFPARSFFNIYVEVSLPRVPGTVANYDFPVAGALLYNDAANPLLIENPSITALPPVATYIHGQTTAVPIRFKNANPPYWAADDVLGYLTLAGHGVFTNVVTAQDPCPEITAVGGLLDQTFGPVGAPIAPPPIPWVRTSNQFPTPGAGYDSVVNTVVDSGITNVLDDTVSFGAITLRGLKLGNFPVSISPPSVGVTANYFFAGSVLNAEMTVDGVIWLPTASTGPGSMKISNPAGGGAYDTEMLGLNLDGSHAGIGPFMIRESPTKQSLGKHTIAPDPGGYRIGSFFDVWFELSTDGGASWEPADDSVRLLASLPPPSPRSIFIRKVGTNVVLEWQNNFTLQSSPSLLQPFTDMGGANNTGNYTNAITETMKFYRLR